MGADDTADRLRAGARHAGTAVLAGGIASLVFPPFGAGWLAPFILVPAARALTAVRSVAGGAAWGFLFGVTQQVALGSWLAMSLVREFDLGWRVGLVLSAWVCLVCAWPYAVFGGLAVRLRSRALPSALAFAVAFGSAEALRSYGPAPLPWLRLGDALVPYPVALQGASLVGVVGLSFGLAAMAGALAQAWEQGARRPALLGFAGMAAALVLGALRLASFEPTGPTVPVGLIQIATPQPERFQEETREAHLAAQLALTREALDAGARLVVWSETALDFLPGRVPDLAARIGDALAADPDSGLLAGRWLDEGEGRTSNAVSAFDARGVARAHYRKQILVPWSERPPAWLEPGSRLRRRFKQFVTDTSYVAGTSAEPLSVAGVQAGVLVCYESLFEGLSRATVGEGAELLVNVSNDAFFPSPGEEQHWMLAVVRAVEVGRPLVRVSNRGVGGVVDATGRTRLRLRRDVPQTGHAEVAGHRGATLYSRGGHLFDEALLLMAAVFCLPWARRAC